MESYSTVKQAIHGSYQMKPKNWTDLENHGHGLVCSR